MEFRRLGLKYGPALLLAVLSPIVAEYLLADFTIRNLGILIVFIPLYGCAALLIREVARRRRRGWPTIILLAAAYALLEEAFLTQSLFNPNYVGQRLLDYGYIPGLGTSLNWSLFVLSIHVVWSVATPILIAEGLSAHRRTEPWLNAPGLTIAGVLFSLGCGATAAFSIRTSPFVASRAQFVTSGILVLTLLGAAFMVGRGDRRSGTRSAQPAAPAPWTQAVFALVSGVVFLVAEPVARDRGLAPWVALLSRTTCLLVATVLIAGWARRQGWGALHYLALAAGTTTTYGLFGLMALLQGHTNLGVPTDRIDIAGQIVMSLGVLALIALAAQRNMRLSGAVVAS